MSGSREELKGLPDIYLSPSRSQKSSKFGNLGLSDNEYSVWDDTDSEVWTALVPEVTALEGLQLESVSGEEDSPELALGQREEIEGDSSIDSAMNNNNISDSKSQAVSCASRDPEGSRESIADGISESQEQTSQLVSVGSNSGPQWKHKRGETPGSDCPPVPGMGAVSRIFRQPLELSTNTQLSKSELVFSPGGDEGFIVPGGVRAYYGTGSGSETDDLEWQLGAEGSSPVGVPVRDAVEGADNTASGLQTYVKNRSVTPAGPASMERNSPAGLSTPDADIDLSFRTTAVNCNKPKSSRRPPVVGQSEEMQVQASRKDLGSTDGEESDDDDQKRVGFVRDTEHLPLDIQQHSLGSQSENTDSVNTVLDMSRGEVQGCETDETVDTPVLSPSQIEPNLTHVGPKPTFVVGGPIAPQGKFRKFQNTVRGRMQDVMASLELEPNVDSKMYVDREQFLSQPPLCPPAVLVSEQEVSLASMISVESTNHPESSDRVTSPSVLSVSSAASSKRLEWDSGADVGYAGNTPEQITSSLSTLERIALGSYASVLRTEPEGTTFVTEKQKPPKKIIKSTSTKLVGKPGPSKRSYLEEASASSLKFLRGFPPREKYKLSSSEEDFENRFSSPGNSPRRRPRRKPASSNIKKQDLPIKSVIRTKKAFGRLKEVMKELNNEGKASSLVELNRTSRPIPECRSSSQQSLSYPPDNYSRSKVSSNVSVAACSSTSVATTVCQSTKPDENSVAGSPTAGFSRKELESKDANAEMDKTSSQKPLPQQVQLRSGDKLSVTSSNEISSKSHGSSEAESVSDVRDTDGDSCPSSNLVSDEEPVNLKARKNSENAKNHENITKQKLRLRKERPVQSHWQRSTDDSSSSSSLQRSSGLDFSGSVLESQVSLQSCNNALQALSVRLRERIQALLDSGTMKKAQDYNKLQDYVAFIGTPSVNEEECRLKQGVASVIMRMFGEIGADDTDASNTMNSESSEPVTPTSLTNDSKAQSVNECIITSEENADHISQSEAPVRDTCSKIAPLSSERVVSPREEITRSVTPGGTIKLVPYRPPSATRTYFMAVSCDVEEGLVGGERGDSPINDPILAEASTAREDDLRGQAEGQREARDDDSETPSATAYSAETREDIIHLDDALTCERSDGNPPQFSCAKDWEDDESETLSAEMALPSAWNNDARSQLRAIGLPGAVTSDDSSPRRVGQYSTWDRRSSWHEDDKESRFAEATNWKFATTKSERLYKDKLGTLHIAKQPPGYTDDRDSHQSESTSDHEPHFPRTNDTESQEDGRPYVHPWTSSGSESAYETIRERHRHVDEALASSFEFYSTSPRDARLLGYVSSDAEKGQEKEEDNTADLDEPLDTEQMPDASPLHALPSPSDESSNKRQVKNRKKSLSRQEQQESHSSLEGATFISNLSSHTDGNDLSSSQVSFIKIQKHRYVQRIQRYIDSLEKLERALVGQLGESVGSESSLRRYVTEGRSHTESDSNNKTQTRDILGQSETASSSTVSSDLSVDISHRKSHPPRWRKKGALTRSESHPVSQDRKLEEGNSYAAPPPLMHSSLASSPRISMSHRSSDVASSRASTLKQIEKEVRMLALAEKKSRHAMQSGIKLQSQSDRGTRRSHYKNIQKIHREEPRGEEDPTRSLVVSRRGTLDSNLSANYSVPDQFLSQKGAASSKKLQRTSDIDSDSFEEATAQDIAENQISRQGDGRETRDTKLAGKTPMALFSGTYNQSNMSGPVLKGNEPLPKSGSRQATQRDFSQMFPSMLCLHPDADRSRQSIGVQTSTSLLCTDGREIENISVTSRSSTRYYSGNDIHENVDAPSGLYYEQNSTKPKNVRQDNRNSERDQIPNAMEKRNAYIVSKDQRNIEAAADPSEKCSETNPMVNKQQSIIAVESSQPDTNSERIIESPLQDCQPSVSIQGSQKENAKKSNQGESQTSNSSSAKRQSYMNTSDFKMLDAPRSYSTGNEEQLAVPVDKQTSKLNSGRREKDAELNQLLKLRIIQSEMMETNFRDNASSPFCQQNEKSHTDFGITENSHTKTGPSVSESSIVNDLTRTSYSDIRMNTDSTRTADIRSIPGHIKQLSKHSANERCGKSLSEDNTKDSLPSNSEQYGNTNVLNLQAQEISSGQRDIENESVLQMSRSSHGSDYVETDLLSGMPTSSRAESEILRNAKNRVLRMYSNQLMPFKQYTENDSDGLRTPEESRRSIQSKQYSDFVQKQKKPVSFEVTVKDKENVHKDQPKSNIIYTPQGRSGVFVDLTKKNLTLQEALSKARPNYIREASERRALIRLKQDMRQAAQSHNHEVITQLPTNLQTPSTLQRFLYKPDIAPLFSYRDIREQNRRLYQLLPEANIHRIKSHRTAQNHTNRLMAEMYSQKLRKKVLKGSVSHGHKDIVTPTSLHRK